MQYFLSTENRDIFKERKVSKKNPRKLKISPRDVPWANRILAMAKVEYFSISSFMNLVYFGVNIQNPGKSTYWSDNLAENQCSSLWENGELSGSPKNLASELKPKPWSLGLQHCINVNLLLNSALEYYQSVPHDVKSICS